MAFDYTEFKGQIEKTLAEFHLNDPAAVELLLGTAAIESDFGTYLHQIRGPAEGPFQMEPATFLYLKKLFVKDYPAIGNFQAEDMQHNLRAAIIMARLKYRSIKAPLPDADDLPGLAAYYKKWYNTPLGAATPAKFIAKYKEYCHA